MRMIIIVPDNTVIIDGKSHPVDCSSMVGVQAIHWNETSGFVEYQSVDFVKQPPIILDDISEYQSWIDSWIAQENCSTPLPPSDSSFIVAQSYAANLRRQADALQAQGKTYEAIKLLLKSSGL